MDLHELLENVSDESSFLDFANALQKEKALDSEKELVNPSSPYSQTALGWENTNIESFLESAVAWAKDSNFGRNQTDNNNPWYMFANFLFAGKIYE